MGKEFAAKILGAKFVDGYCVQPPFGCGDIISDFNDELSAREFEISSLCQKCQDKIFSEDN